MLQGRILLVTVALLTGGCRIIQTAGQGGDIISQSGSYDCAQGLTCEADIENGTPLNEVFTATPREGFAFAGWRKAPAHLCGGETGPCATGAIPGSITAFDVDLFLEAEFYHQPEVVSPGAAAIDFVVWQAAPLPERIGYQQTVDLNEDGHQDLVITGVTYPDEPFEAARAGIILINNGDFTFSTAGGDLPFSAHAREVLTEDFDGNGLLDVFIADHGWDAPPFPGYNNQLLLQTENGFVDVSERLPDDPTGFTHNASAGDIDNDGDVDILINNNGGSNAPPYFAINDGTGHFVRSTAPMPDFETQGEASPWWSWASQMEDLDGDGYVDVVLGGWDRTDSESRIYWGNPAGVFSESAVTVLAAPESVSTFGNIEVISTRVTDIDGDGLPDLILGSYDSPTISKRSLQLLINQGDRTFQDQTKRRLGDTAFSADEGWQTLIRLIDFNGDGTIDIVPEFYDAGEGNILAWLNDGTGHYAVLRTTDLSDPEAIIRLSRGVYIKGADGSFETHEIFDFENEVTANSAIITEGAVITTPE